MTVNQVSLAAVAGAGGRTKPNAVAGCILGAYLGIYLKQVGASLEQWSLGAPRLVHIEKDRLHIYALPLPEGYYLVLVQRRPALVGKARIQLDRAGEQLVQTLF